MNTGTLRRQSGFLDTGLEVRRPRPAPPGPIRGLIGEAAEMLRGAFGAPLGHAAQMAAHRDMERLSPNLRKDIGLDA